MSATSNEQPPRHLYIGRAVVAGGSVRRRHETIPADEVEDYLTQNAVIAAAQAGG